MRKNRNRARGNCVESPRDVSRQAFRVRVDLSLFSAPKQRPACAEQVEVPPRVGCRACRDT